MGAVTTLAVLAMLSSACSSPGHIDGASSDARFVTEKGYLWLSTPDIARVSLDGTGLRPMFPGFQAEYVRVADVTGDWSALLLANQPAGLYLGDVGTGVTRRLSAVDGLYYPTAKFSPDGEVIAARAGPPYGDRPKKGASETVFLIDRKSLEVRATIPLPLSDSSWHLDWSADGAALWLTSNGPRAGARTCWITLGDRQVHEGYSAPPTPLERPHPATADAPGATCARTLTDNEFGSDVLVTDPGEKPHVVVHTVGFRMSPIMEVAEGQFHDSRLTPGCGYVTFRFDGGVWIADARGGAVGPVAKGRPLFVQPL